jgi:hypothetical protein
MSKQESRHGYNWECACEGRWATHSPHMLAGHVVRRDKFSCVIYLPDDLRYRGAHEDLSGSMHWQWCETRDEAMEWVARQLTITERTLSEINARDGSADKKWNAQGAKHRPGYDYYADNCLNPGMGETV